MSVWPPFSSATTGLLPYVPVRLEAGDDALALQHADGLAVERDVDRGLAARDLAVVLDDLGARLGGALDRERRAGVERDEDDDLGAVREALVGLRLLLLRITVGVVDHVRDAGLLEGGDERRAILGLPAHRRLRVRQQDADVRARLRLEDLPCATAVAVTAIAASARPTRG